MEVCACLVAVYGGPARMVTGEPAAVAVDVTKWGIKWGGGAHPTRGGWGAAPGPREKKTPAFAGVFLTSFPRPPPA